MAPEEELLPRAFGYLALMFDEPLHVRQRPGPSSILSLRVDSELDVLSFLPPCLYFWRLSGQGVVGGSAVSPLVERRDMEVVWRGREGREELVVSGNVLGVSYTPIRMRMTICIRAGSP